MVDQGSFDTSDLEEAHTITSGWQSQQNLEPSCTPCSLFNIMYELSQRIVAPLDICPTYKDVCKVLEYSDILGVKWDIIEPAMSKILRKSKNKLWMFKTKQNDRSLPVKLLCEIIKSENCSYPIMSLGPEYLNDEYGIELKGNPFNWPGHVIVVIRCNDGDCLIFDPYSKQIMQEPVRTISKERLNKYWYSTSPPRSLGWFERNKGVLEEYPRS